MRTTVAALTTLTLLSLAACKHRDRDTHEPSSHASSSTEGARHPAYLQALSDLKSARGHLERKNPNDSEHIRNDTQAAVAAIDRAMTTVKQAAREDGKNLDHTPDIDRDKDTRSGQLHKALDDLKSAKRNVDMSEDNAEVKELRRRALNQINDAIKYTNNSISAVNRGS